MRQSVVTWTGLSNACTEGNQIPFGCRDRKRTLCPETTGDAFLSTVNVLHAKLYESVRISVQDRTEYPAVSMGMDSAQRLMIERYR